MKSADQKVINDNIVLTHSTNAEGISRERIGLDGLAVKYQINNGLKRGRSHGS